MKRQNYLIFFIVLFLIIGTKTTQACSIVYYVDSLTGKVYVLNNEDYWYNTKAYIQIQPKTKKHLARLWYGWDNFAQGGINEAGLFFDGASTPKQEIPKQAKKRWGNLGDELLAQCTTVQEALDFLDKKELVLYNAHMLLGDKSGYAVVVEWWEGKRKIIPIQNYHLTITNFLLSDSSQTTTCPRYNSIEKNIVTLQNQTKTEPPTFRQVGNIISSAVQVPRADKDVKIGGTLYSSFINITDMEFILVFKLDNNKLTKLDLNAVFDRKKRQKIKLQ